MAKLAFLGLGLMGTPMATRLLEAGHDVTVWNRTAEKTKPLADHGASVASTPAQAAAGDEAVITMLTNPEALQQVVLGEDGLAEALAPGQLLIDMSTVGSDAVRDVGSRLPPGVTMVDAPVRGSVPEATAGRLAIYVGAERSDFRQVEPILAPLGTLHHVGGPGAGAATKLAVNYTLVAAMAAFGEALALGDTLGLDRSALLDVLAESPIGSMVRAKRADIESGHYPPNFKLSLALKDLGLVNRIARRAGRHLPVASASRGWLERASQAGAGDLDISAVIPTIVDSDLIPESPQAAGVADPAVEAARLEGAHVLADEAHDRLAPVGLTDDEILGWAQAFLQARHTGDLDEFIAWIRDQEHRGRPRLVPS